MKLNGLILLFLSCGLSFTAAVWAFTAGFGLIVAFFVYAFGGALLVLGFTALAFVPLPSLASRNTATRDPQFRLVALREH